MTQAHPKEGVQTFKLDQRGLARVFGELEAAVMDAVWNCSEASVAEVCQRLGKDEHYKTVMTVMNRLVQKGVLRRRRESRAYLYSATQERDDFESRLSRRVAEGLVRDYGDLAVAQFVDALDAVDPELLDRLEAMVRLRANRISAEQALSAEADAQDHDPEASR